MSMQPTKNVLVEVFGERVRQDMKWGQQSHPDGTGDFYAPHARVAKEACQNAERAAGDEWALILLEEVYEALEQSDPAKLREELVQTAAVCASWVEAIDRRTA